MPLLLSEKLSPSPLLLLPYTRRRRCKPLIPSCWFRCKEKGSNEIVFKAMGRAINKTVMIVELVMRRIVGLHQNTQIGSTDITDTWEPLEEGFLPLETTRHVLMITITLSKKEINMSCMGLRIKSIASLILVPSST
ncbi:hypothetical protein PIB30_118553 [Stylosanthes scabra]|uniref:DNA/RNA-binding protein Alba-like domain-containing protein n=1 Tax=Stylosanthes scabra TaxID=79078 RepID=A0ABU6UKD9_9FABA|nr:hypothetical protein [Stylosanthes scabra]